MSAQTLPDAPSALLRSAAPPVSATGTGDGAATDEAADGELLRKGRLPPCTDEELRQHRRYLVAGLPGQPVSPPGEQPLTDPTCRDISRQQIVVDSKAATPLTSADKGRLAIRDVIDPLNLVFVAGYSAIAIASNSHTAYGPGFQGFGKFFGYSMLQAAQGEFLGTYLIPSIAHQDPRYHRLPNASFKRRLGHALAHTVVTSHDDGSAMPNYATLFSYPLSAELSNLYVPGVQTDGVSTFKRVAIGLATDPAGSVIAEFLPDVARRIHIRVVFVQEILNRAIVGSPNTF